MTPDKTNTQAPEASADLDRLDQWFKFFNPGLVNAAESLECREAIKRLRAALTAPSPSQAPDPEKLVKEFRDAVAASVLHGYPEDAEKEDMLAVKIAAALRPAPSPQGLEALEKEIVAAACLAYSTRNNGDYAPEKALYAAAEAYLRAPTPSETLTAPATLMERMAVYLEDAECECDKSTGHVCDRCSLIKVIAAPKGAETPARPLESVQSRRAKLAMSIVNYTCENTGVPVKVRQELNDRLFAWAENQLEEYAAFRADLAAKPSNSNPLTPAR